MLTSFTLVWNTHERITRETALAHIHELSSFTPPVTIESPFITAQTSSEKERDKPYDLDTPDELAVRSLILGIVHRTLGEFAVSRKFLQDAYEGHEALDCNWVGGVAQFELAVLDLKEVDASDPNSSSVRGASRASIPSITFDSETKEKDTRNINWPSAIKSALEKLDKAMTISGNNVDLSSRLDTRVNMLRDEIALKKEMLGLS